MILATDIKSSPKSFYAYVKSKAKVKEVVGPLKDNNNELVSVNEVMWSNVYLMNILALSLRQKMLLLYCFTESEIYVQ